MDSNSPPFSKVVVACGTYDGVLAGWELDFSKKKKFKIAFATPVHEGSVRSIVIAQRNPDTTNDADEPGSLLSCGYDEVLQTHDFSKKINSTGEIKTPTEFGTPSCSGFAPPLMLGPNNQHEPPPASTHCLIGFSEGKMVIYKKRDWSVQHVLAGHDGGISCIAVHPSGKMCLTGGESDGKLKLWDLTKGRLAFVSKINPSQAKGGRTLYDAVSNIVWTSSTFDGREAYAFCYGNHITVRDVANGNDLLDVDLPSKVNEICLLSVEEGLFVAAACNDGSLPVLAVDDGTSEERRAIMAIEPVDGPIAGEERFKCIKSLVDGYVVTANSAGVVSLMDLKGAIRMIMSDQSEGEEDTRDQSSQSEQTDNEEDEDDEQEGDEELAVDIIDGVQLGTGARITCLGVWCASPVEDGSDSEDEQKEAVENMTSENEPTQDESGKKRQRSEKHNRTETVTINDDALKRARELVASAKKIQTKKDRKKKKQKQTR